MDTPYNKLINEHAVEVAKPDGHATNLPKRVIEPLHGWAFLRLNELWEYRELIWVLAGRDIAVRYKQTIFGVAWAIIQPITLMVVFTVFFHRWGGIESEGVPYPIFNYTAMLPWQYFSAALSGASAGLLRNTHLFTKIYFPRLIIPISNILPPLADLAIAFVILLGMMCFYYHMMFTWRLLILPVLLLILIVNVLGMGIWFCALSVEYRDVTYTFPAVIQLMLFASPIVYSSRMIPWRWQSLYSLNPLVGIIDGFRWMLFGHYDPPLSTLTAAFIVGVVVLVSGVIYFQRMERTFADVV